MALGKVVYGQNLGNEFVGFLYHSNNSNTEFFDGIFNGKEGMDIHSVSGFHVAIYKFNGSGISREDRAYFDRIESLAKMRGFSTLRGIDCDCTDDYDLALDLSLI